MYPEYKATRAPTPDDLISQMPHIDALVAAFDIPMIRIVGVEADDVIGTLARTAERAGMESLIVTGDKDALQLLSDKIKVDPNKGDGGSTVPRTPWNVWRPPEHVVDTMALMGDSADNVPGVRGIGEKTALIEKYGSRENLYENIDELKGETTRASETDKEMAFFSRELVTIKTTCRWNFHRRPPPPSARPFPHRQEFLKHEFRAWQAGSCRTLKPTPIRPRTGSY
jgi:DNA polymerase-1